MPGDAPQPPRAHGATAAATAARDRLAGVSTLTASDALEAVLASLGEGVVVADERGTFVLWNPAAARLVGMDPADLPQERWSAHYQIFLADGVTPYPPEQLPLARAIRGEAVTDDVQFLRREGSTGVWLSVTGRPLIDGAGRHRGGVVVFRDITEQRRAEEEIRRLNDALRPQVRELETANAELEAFCYTVSHDLRAPLRAMQGFSSILLEDYAARLDATACDYAGRIAAAAERMDQLIQDLLAYSRLSRADLRLTPVDTERAVADALEQLHGTVSERHADVAIERPLLAVVAHHRTLVQVVVNLLGNAVKFVAPGTRPNVRVRSERRDGAVRLWVEDNGIGIEPEYHARIFRVFERLHGSESYPGNGTGLAIVLKSAERMGGRAGVESEAGAGSRFWIELEAA